MNIMNERIENENEAEAAGVGTIVLLDDNGGSLEFRRVAVQKHDDGWFLATGWELAIENSEVKGDVLVDGEIRYNSYLDFMNEEDAAAAYARREQA